MLTRFFYRFWDFWLRRPEQHRLLLLGGFNSLIIYLLFAVSLCILGDGHYQVNLLLSWMFSSFASFSLMKIFVFCSHGSWCAEYKKCAVSWLVSYAVNALALALFVGAWAWNPCWAQLVAIGIYGSLTYWLFSAFLFRHLK